MLPSVFREQSFTNCFMSHVIECVSRPSTVWSAQRALSWEGGPAEVALCDALTLPKVSLFSAPGRVSCGSTESSVF